MFAAGGPGPFLSWGSCHRTFLNRKGKSWELKTDQLETQEVLSQPTSDVGGRGGTSCGTSAHSVSGMYQSCRVSIRSDYYGTRRLRWLPRDVAVPAVTCYRVKHIMETLESSGKAGM